MEEPQDTVREEIIQRLRAIKAQCEYFGLNPAHEFSRVAMPKLFKPPSPRKRRRRRERKPDE